MKDADIVERWLNRTPSREPVRVVRGVLIRRFGEDALCKGTGDSHQLRVKHSGLARMPGFGLFGLLSIPIHKGQWVKGYYLKRIAQAIERLEEVADEEKEIEEE